MDNHFQDFDEILNNMEALTNLSVTHLSRLNLLPTKMTTLNNTLKNYLAVSARFDTKKAAAEVRLTVLRLTHSYEELRECIVDIEDDFAEVAKAVVQICSQIIEWEKEKEENE